MHPMDNRSIATSQPIHKTNTTNQPYCHVCKSSTQIIEKTLPYASKLFTQEVKALGIEMKLEL
jgi:DNA-directed RNA polymerase beta subunit